MRESDQVFYLAGYAGTGKTTLAQHFAAGAGRIAFAAFTGKAAHVMRQKGCTGATTIHSLIYTSRARSKARLRDLEIALLQMTGVHQTDETAAVDPRITELRRQIAQERQNCARPAFSLNEESDLRSVDLLVVDECSMVDGRMGEDLMSFGCKILVLGDPAQLPPVFSGGFFTARTPDIMLTEIHRQARDNPIIRMATMVREGEGLPLGEYGESRVVTSDQIDRDEYTGADQILVGKNKTRHSINRRLRVLQEREGVYPVEGDRVVCLRNNHELGLLNGSLWQTKDCLSVDDDRLVMSVISDEDSEVQVDCEVFSAHFRGQGDKIDWTEKQEAQEFDYGYALTVHKSQGSQWRRVLLVDEWTHSGSRKEWLYTGITRAAERIVVVRW